jgi:hypothetical protein
MIEYLEDLLRFMRPAFSRKATFAWFVVVLVGLVMRSDTFGVSSIVRALSLAPSCYPCLLHFFHSSAWKGENLMACWWKWLVKEGASYRVGGRIVLVGDHTKTPKDGRRMPQVTCLHQDSETASKPTFFRGHNWACLGLLINAGKRFFATGLWAEIHRDGLPGSMATRIVQIAGQIAKRMDQPAYLVLDAFFAVGPVFQTAAKQEGFLHVLTRAKKNVVAYRTPPRPKKKGRGRPRKYGRKLELMKLFDAWEQRFKTAEAEVYQKLEKVRYLTLDLIWKPTKGLLRFFLIETSRGRIILITSDLALEPLMALNLYCRRTTIEALFDALKNILGGMRYHFWSRYLQPASRRPAKKKKIKQTSSRPEKTQNTLAAIEKFLLVHLMVLGVLQLLARRFGPQVLDKARCWLRTPCGKIPSEFVTRTALSNSIRANLFSFAKNWITQLILEKQNKNENTEHSRKAA